jgi:hypothetical protein
MPDIGTIAMQVMLERIENPASPRDILVNPASYYKKIMWC